MFPSFFLILIWMVKIFESFMDMDLSYLGLFPLTARGLIGIITSPLIHSNYKHLFDNSIPLFFLSTSIFYFYKPVAYKVFFLTYVLTGIWVWFGARSAYHVGSSGLVYGFASFLFFSGIIRRNVRLLAISLLVSFLYGGLVWGIFPYKAEISWESHLFGGIAGLFLAIYYKNQGPRRKEPDWDQGEEMDEDKNEDDYWNRLTDENMRELQES